jgi:glycosyltransferase involved in cell wall biosynthesis
MRVLMISSGLDKIFGGPPEAVAGAACALAKLGVSTSVAVFGQTLESWNASHFKDVLESNSVESHFFPSRWTSKYGGICSLKDLTFLWNEIRRTDFCTLHQVYNFQNILCVMFIRIQHKRFAVMPHGSMTSYQMRKHRIRKFFVSPIFMHAILDKADRIFVATNEEKEEIPRKWRYKSNIVGLGIATHLVANSRQKKKNPCFTFMYMGRLTPKKRIDVTLRSLKRATELSSKPIRLIVCGSGDQAIVNQVIEYQKSSGLLQVEYRGWIGGLEKEELLSSADCFILTSEDENFAIAVAEGLSFGLPSLISSKVALSSLVMRYSAGSVFTRLDIETIAIEAVKIMDSDLSLLSENAFKASKELHWDFVGKNWALEISKIAGEG